MGNCLKGSSNDDISLLNENEPPVENANEIIRTAPFPDHAAPVYYPAPNDRRSANQLSEEEQVRIARRMGLLEHLPVLSYDDSINKNRECVICMVDFNSGDKVRFLPCMHIYHVKCIDDWLMRSFTCPSCLEPVDAALLTSYDTN